MAVFRIEKTRDYTVMSNYHLRDRSLSLKAKGLLSLMLSLPEDWDYTMKGLARICKDGIDSISGGIRELETHGYLVRARVRNENGQLGSIEYTILEQPKEPAQTPAPIRDMVREIVSTYSCISEDGKKLFAPEKESIGACPRCGQPVYEGKKNFACSDRSCGFVLWKNDRFWTSRRKELTKKMAADLLKKGRTSVRGMWSEKKQTAYDAAVILCDTGGRYIDFKLEFPKNKRS